MNLTDPKRPYQPPRLGVYGNLRDVTLSSLTDQMNDRGSSAQTMT